MSIETMDIILSGLTALILVLVAVLFADYIIDHLKDEEEQSK